MASINEKTCQGVGKSRTMTMVFGNKLIEASWVQPTGRATNIKKNVLHNPVDGISPVSLCMIWGKY